MFRFKIQSVPAQEIPELLENGDDIIWQGSGTVISKTVQDNQDGSETITSVIKPLLVEVRKSSTPLEAPIFKDTIKHKSWSQKVRDLLYRLHIERGGSESTFESYYAQKMQDYCDKIVERIEEAKGV